ncbi:MAG TPA: hypothetical protein VG759_05105 [Candidatus Angelobacter sp.]|jgi:hypothetical protein|nr:hypothetical protein [Candidatus Angelobacter sp.]
MTNTSACPRKSYSRSDPYGRGSVLEFTVEDRVDLMEKGFQLAYFILQDRSAAIRVVMDAFNKLAVQHNREQKRVYWRDKHLKGKITRISRHNTDALQWLICFECEQHEKQQEQLENQASRTMVVRYIKHLLQISTPMSAFYVSVGLHRLLFNYNTSELQRVYEWVTEHYPGPQEYRRVKGALMSQLQERFTDLIQTTKGHHGELRFETMENQDDWADFVDQCLKIFRPWSISHSSEASHIEPQALLDMLASKIHAVVDHDRTETYQCHLFIDPSCYQQITRKLGLDPPRQRLALPRFYFNASKNKNQESSGDGVPKLTDEEQESITEHLATEAKRRQRFAPTLVKIMAHGKEYARLNPDKGDWHYSKLPEGVKLIEVWVEQQGEDILLATHWVDYTEWHGIAAANTIIGLGDKKELLIKITPTSELTSSASLALKCRSIVFFSVLEKALEPFSWLQKQPKLVFGAIGLLAVGWILGAFLSKRELALRQATVEAVSKELAHEKALREALQQTAGLGRPSTSTPTYQLVPDDIRVRSPQGDKPSVVHLTSNSALAVLELPFAAQNKTSYRAVFRSFLDRKEILSEVFTEASLRDNNSIKFALPSALVEDGKYYTISLDSIGAGGRAEAYRTFTFLVTRD